MICDRKWHCVSLVAQPPPRVVASGTGKTHIFFAQPNHAILKCNQHHLKAHDTGYSKIKHRFIFDVFWMSYGLMNFCGGSWFVGMIRSYFDD